MRRLFLLFALLALASCESGERLPSPPPMRLGGPMRLDPLPRSPEPGLQSARA